MRHFFTLLLLAVCSTVLAQVKIASPCGTILITPLADNAVRVQCTSGQADTDIDRLGLIYVSPESPKVKVKETDSQVKVTLKGMAVVYYKAIDALTFVDADGRTILSEKAGGRTLQPGTVQGEATYICGQRFMSPDDEYLFGTGQFQDGYLNVRSLTRRLTQVNTQISLPFVTSNKGYALLWNNYGLTDFNPSDETIGLVPVGGDGKEVTVDVTSTTGNRRETRTVNAFRGTVKVDVEGDYSILVDVGQRMARKHHVTIDGKVMADFNNLWLPPTVSFMTHLTAGEHEVIVAGDKNDSPTVGWRLANGETEFRSPVSWGIDYTVFCGNADEAIAAYRKVTGGSPMMPRWALGYIHCRERYDTQSELLENASEFRRREIPVDVIVQDWQWWGKHGWNAMRFDEGKYPDPKLMVDSLHNQGMKLMLSVWSKIDRNSELGKDTASKGYYIPGTEWIDFFNPVAADYYWDNFSSRLLKPYGIDAWWQDATEPENDDLLDRRVGNGSMAGEVVRNVYPLMVNKTVFTGLRKDAPERRHMILTRSGFPGIQRYGAATWSGDVGNDWQTLRCQIAGGLGQMAAGLPWWTYDAGGFFRPGDQYSNKNYHELFIRWLQAGTFLPLMRVHGYMSQTEPWRYGEEVERLSRKYIELRYTLLPYIYSVASQVSLQGYTMMRPLVMDFPDDAEALRQTGEYMFGPSILVVPVTAPGVKTWKAYLPKGCDWFDFWTGKQYSGGQTVETDATIDKIPLFVRAGSIIPMAQKGSDDIELCVYANADGHFALYEDEGDNYNYEQGQCSTIALDWNDETRTVTIGRRKGSYPGMPAMRRFHVNVKGLAGKTVDYSGKKLTVRW